MKICLLLTSTLVWPHFVASQSVFSVHDDVLAYPQYEIDFPDSFVHAGEARTRLQSPTSRTDSSGAVTDSSSDLAHFRIYADNQPIDKRGDSSDPVEYEYIIKYGRPYQCSIPIVKRQPQNKTESKPSQEEQEKELARATDRGWELLKDMKGKCLYYTTGWWSYSFCYNSQVKQFHSLAPGVNGAPLWPPSEDPTTPTYVLGQFDQKAAAKADSDDKSNAGEVTELQRQADTSYMVQRLDGGTQCDLTGQDRKIEVQFHCNPQSTDRIGWIKETATCTYLMVVYTPRLCNDVAFLPPKETSAHSISCYEILNPDEVEEWKRHKAENAQRRLIDQPSNQRMIVGNVEVGAMNQIGREGKKLERGRVVLTPEEKAETLAAQRNGRVQGLSRADLEKMELNPDEIESFKEEMQRVAGKKDWKIERLDDVNGNIQLRGVVATEDDEKAKKDDEGGEGNEESSEGTYHEEI